MAKDKRKRKHGFIPNDHTLANFTQEIIGLTIDAKKTFMVLHAQFVPLNRVTKVKLYHPYLKKDVYYVSQYNYQQRNRLPFRKGGFGIAQIFAGQDYKKPLTGNLIFDYDNVFSVPKPVVVLEKEEIPSPKWLSDIFEINSFFKYAPENGYTQIQLKDFFDTHKDEYSYMLNMKYADATFKLYTWKEPVNGESTDYITRREYKFSHLGLPYPDENIGNVIFPEYKVQKVFAEESQYFKLAIITSADRKIFNSNELIKDPLNPANNETIKEIVKHNTRVEFNKIEPTKYKNGDGYEFKGDPSELTLEDLKEFIPVKFEKKEYQHKEHVKIYGENYELNQPIFTNGSFLKKGFYVQIEEVDASWWIKHKYQELKKEGKLIDNDPTNGGDAYDAINAILLDMKGKLIHGYGVFIHPLFYEGNDMPVCGFRRFVETYGETHKMEISNIPKKKGAWVKWLGGALMIVGMVLAPYTAGSSLALTKMGAVGIGLSLFTVMVTGMGMVAGTQVSKVTKWTGLLGSVMTLGASFITPNPSVGIGASAGAGSAQEAASVAAQKTSASLFSSFSQSSLGKFSSIVSTTFKAVNTVLSVVRGGDIPEYYAHQETEKEKDKAGMIDSEKKRKLKKFQWYNLDVPLDV